MRTLLLRASFALLLTAEAGAAGRPVLPSARALPGTSAWRPPVLIAPHLTQDWRPSPAPALAIGFAQPPAGTPLLAHPAVPLPDGAFPSLAASPAAAPASPAPQGAASPAPQASDAAAAVQAGADFVGAARRRAKSEGLESGAMSWGDFLRAMEQELAQAPPSSLPAAAVVREQFLRVARGLAPAESSFEEASARAATVFGVLHGELSAAAESGGVDAVSAEARLFADQVEASPVQPLSLAPAREAEPAAAPAEEPGVESVPGSVFPWRPAHESPDHGAPTLDRLARRVLAERTPRPSPGFEFRGAPRREDARVFLYGERHTDEAMVAVNMRRLVEDVRPGWPAVVLVESYLGPTLRGHEASEWLSRRGVDARALMAKASALEVRGWDEPQAHGVANREQLRHHMRLLELNALLHGDLKGWRYYAQLGAGLWRAALDWRRLWRLAIVARNADLDRAVSTEAAEASRTGGTVHVIAGADHLVESPRWDPWLRRAPRLREGLRRALAGLPHWGFRPADSPPNLLQSK